MLFLFTPFFSKKAKETEEILGKITNGELGGREEEEGGEEILDLTPLNDAEKKYFFFQCFLFFVFLFFVLF